MTPELLQHGGTGNPYYMAPEQARGEPADYSSDLFMVGIIGYLLLSGRHPFTHPTGLFSIPELIRDPTFIPDSPRPSASLTTSEQRLFREYAAVVMRLMHREKAGRFPSAREAVEAIDAVTPSVDCPACGERVPDHHSFCGFCGRSLKSPEPASRPSKASANELADEGFRLSKLQRWNEAISYFQMAIERERTFQQAYWNLGYALNRVGRYEEAIKILEAGLKLGGKQAEHLSHFYYGLAFANSNLTKYGEALTQIEDALKLEPDSVRSLYLRARIHVYLSEFDRAIADATEVLKRVPDHPGAIRLLEDLRRPS